MNRYRRIFALLCLTVASSAISFGLVSAGPLENAAEAIESGNTPAAISILHPLAELGSAEAQLQLGYIHQNGLGVPQDFGTAARWFAAAAEKGNAEAQNALGRLFVGGLGVNKDADAGLAWLTKAAEQGKAEHQFDLAALYDGAGETPDPTAAARWYQKAHNQGHVGATASLGLLYYQGSGVDKDLQKALVLLTTAAEQGHARAQNNVGLMYVKGEGVPQNYETAAKWFAAAAEQGLSKAMTNLGVMYDNGFGVPQDDNKAIELYRLGGRSGDTTAAATIEGTGYIYDPRLAKLEPEVTAEAFANAAKQGDPIAMFLLGYVHASGGGQPADYFEAANWFQKAAERGLPAAMANLGLLYVRGLGVPQDYVYGYMWINLAAAAGLKEAVETRDAIAASLSSSQLNEAQQLALQQWPRIEN